MIEQTKSYKTSDGAVHLTLESAKAAEIVIQLMNTPSAKEEFGSSEDQAVIRDMATVMANNSEVFAEILGKRARKPRKPKSTKPVKSTKPSDAPKPAQKGDL